jgi:putative resolvase
MPVPFIKTDSGTILVTDGEQDRPEALGLYARVSSHDQKADLDRQIARLSQWAAGTGVAVARVEAEVGSGMNGSRVKLRRMLMLLFKLGSDCLVGEPFSVALGHVVIRG